MSKHNREKNALFKHGITRARLGRSLTYAELQQRYRDVKKKLREQANARFT